MKKSNELSVKEKLEHIGLLAIYPFVLFFNKLGKSVKLFNTKHKQVLAGVLAVCVMLAMIPFSTDVVLAASADSSFSANELASKLSPDIDFTEVSGYGDVYYMTDAMDTLGIEKGIVLDTAGNNILGSSQIDDDLEALIEANDKEISGNGHMSALQMTMTATGNLLNFNYVFASREFDQNAKYNDIFALFVSVNGGDFENIAKLNNGQNVTITNLRAGEDGEQLSQGSSTSISTGTQYDYFKAVSLNLIENDTDTKVNGISNLFNAQKEVSVGDTVTLKLVISDVGDTDYNSFVIIEAESLSFLNVGIDYNDESLISLEPESTYKITLDNNEYIMTTDDNGNIPLTGVDDNEQPYTLLGETFAIVQIDSTGEPISEEKEVTVSKRPEVSTPDLPLESEVEKPAEVSVGELSLDGEYLVITPKEGQVYSVDGGVTWLEADTDGKIRVYLGTGLEDSVSIVTKILATATAPQSLISDSVTVTRQELLKTFDSVSAPDVEIDYDGEAHQPSVITTVNGAEVCYSLNSEDNYNSNVQLTESGIYTVYYRITKEGYYPYYGSFQYKINPLLLKMEDFETNVKGLMYTGSAIEPTVSCVNSILSSNDYSVVYQNNINIGTNTASIIITGKNNAIGTVTIPFSIHRHHTHSDNSIYENKFTKISGEITSGNYYLAENITATGDITIPEDTTVTLCLNGKTLDMGEYQLINKGTLTICDCGDTSGVINRNKAYSSAIQNNGTLNISGGTIKNTVEFGRGIYNDGTLNVTGGEIIGEIYGLQSEGKANITGGKITARHAVANSGTMTVDGTAEIVGTTMYGISDSYRLYIKGGTVKSLGSGYGAVISYADTHISGGNISCEGSYAVLVKKLGNMKTGTLHLSGSPVISGNDTSYADILVDTLATHFYANDGEETPTYYSGDKLTVYTDGYFAGTLVYGVDDDSAERFESKGLPLYRVDDNLVIDGIGPTGKISIGENGWIKFWNTVTFGLFGKNYIEITITGSDSHTGLDKIEYYLSDTAVNDTDIKNITGWTVYTNKVKIDANAKKFVYAKLTDRAGNAAYFSVNGGVVVYTDSVQHTDSVNYTLSTKEDRDIDVILNGNTIKSVSLGTTDLILGTDYTVLNNIITLKGTYLDNLAASDTPYTFTVQYNPMGEVYVEATNNTAPATTTFTVMVEKAEGRIENIRDISKAYDGVKVDAPTFQKLGTGDTTIEYKVRGAQDSTYTTTAPTNVGEYTVRITVAGDSKYNATSATADFAIYKASFTADVE